MTPEQLALIQDILDTVISVTELIPKLKVYLDVSDYHEIIMEFNNSHMILIHNNELNQDAISKILTGMEDELSIICADMQDSLELQKINWHLFSPILKYVPKHLDEFINDIPFLELSRYMCDQSKLIQNILSFCSVSKINDIKIFNLYNDKDIHRKWQEIRDIKIGLCFGLSSLFLTCSFISDRQLNKAIIGKEDDLRWFYRCVILLQLAHYNYSLEQQQDITRFISLIIHLQNSKMVSGISNCIYSSKTPVPRDMIMQREHFDNIEFSGNNFLAFDYTRVYNEEFRNFITNSKCDLYIQIGIVKSARRRHAVCLHKNASGVFTFYDPSKNVQNIALNSDYDFMLFKRNCLGIKEEKDIYFVTLGESKPKLQFDLNKSETKLPALTIVDSPTDSQKKRLRFRY